MCPEVMQEGLSVDFSDGCDPNSCMLLVGMAGLSPLLRDYESSHAFGLPSAVERSPRADLDALKLGSSSPTDDLEVLQSNGGCSKPRREFDKVTAAVDNRLGTSYERTQSRT